MAIVKTIPTAPMFQAGKVKDLTGNVYGKLTVIRFLRLDRRHHSMWLCRCVCGTLREVQQGNLKTVGASATKCRHNSYGTKFPMEFASWRGMIDRCYNSASKRDYARYGRRGVSVCPRWRESFAAFLEDMGPRNSPHASIDRINNDGNYEPGNCRWTTAKGQARNRRNNVMLSHDGKTLCLAEWAETTGLPRKVIEYRLKCGWSASLALMTPHIGKRR